METRETSKIIGSSLAILLGGFFLFNLAFIAYAIIGNFVLMFLPKEFISMGYTMPVLMLTITAVLGYVYWRYFPRKANILVKAILLTLPMYVILIILGISTYMWPSITYSASFILVAGIVYYLYSTKQPWQYYFSVLSVSAILLIMNLLGVEI